MVSAIGRRGRWHEFLSQFNIVVVYVPGKDHHVSDALSRWAYPAGLEQDISFHEGQDGEEYAQACDAAEDEYDSFPLRAVEDHAGIQVDPTTETAGHATGICR